MYHSMYYGSHFLKQIFVMLQSAITADLEIKEKNLLVSTWYLNHFNQAL